MHSLGRQSAPRRLASAGLPVVFKRSNNISSLRFSSLSDSAGALNPAKPLPWPAVSGQTTCSSRGLVHAAKQRTNLSQRQATLSPDKSDREISASDHRRLVSKACSWGFRHAMPCAQSVQTHYYLQCKRDILPQPCARPRLMCKNPSPQGHKSRL